VKEWCKYQAKLRTPFHVIALSDNTNVTMVKQGAGSDVILNLSCSKDNINYEAWDPLSSNYIINAGETLYVIGENERIGTFQFKCYSFRFSENTKVAGNIMSLL